MDNDESGLSEQELAAILLSEQELLALLATDLQAHFYLVVQKYERMLYKRALRWTRDHDDAEEVVQNTMVNAYYSLLGFSQDSLRDLKLKAWLYTITYHEICKLYRERHPPSGSIEFPLDNLLSEVEADYRQQQINAAEAEERLEEVLELIHSLPKELEEIFILRYFDDLSYEEIAEQLGRPRGTIANYIHRVRAFLRRALRASTNRPPKTRKRKASNQPSAQQPSEIRKPEASNKPVEEVN